MTIWHYVTSCHALLAGSSEAEWRLRQRPREQCWRLLPHEL